MPTLVRLRSLSIALLLSACARQSPNLAVTPEPRSMLGSPGSVGMAGDYRLTGRLQVTRISATIRVDSSGRVSYFRGSPAGALLCDAASRDSGRLLVRCGTVDISLALDGDRLAPVARIAFDTPKPSRTEYNPFTCTSTPPDQACALLPQTRTPQVRRVMGNVSVERVSE